MTWTDNIMAYTLISQPIGTLFQLLSSDVLYRLGSFHTLVPIQRVDTDIMKL